jgi:hypothetical protein
LVKRSFFFAAFTLPTAPGVPQQSFFGLTNLSSVVMIVKKENDRLAKEVSATAAALWLLALHTKPELNSVQNIDSRQGKDRGCPQYRENGMRT